MLPYVPKSSMKQYTFKVDENLSGKRLDIFLTLKIDRTRSFIQNIIKKKAILVNDTQIIAPKYSVKNGDNILVILPELEKTDIVPVEIPLDIVYEDEDLLVLNKQAGLTTHPGIGNYNNTLVNALLYYLGDNLSSINGIERPGIVHRLDRYTTGLMVVAKNNRAHNSLSAQIQDRTLQRTYKALAWGSIKPFHGVIKANIARSSKDRIRMAVVYSGGKVAITYYNTLEIFEKYNMSLVECKLETGRTHQIRVHLSNMGHSIVGDQVYGHNLRKANNLTDENLKQLLCNFQRQALHSCYISFLHPTTDKTMSFTADIPQDFMEIMEFLRQ